MSKGSSKVRIMVEVEIPEGDEEGLYREEFRRELARRILDVLMERDTQLAREAIDEVLREKSKKSNRKP